MNCTPFRASFQFALSTIVVISLGFSTSANAQYQNNHQRSYHSVQRPVYQSQQNYAQSPSSNQMSTSDKRYTLDGGDLLGLIVQGVLGDFQSAPIHWPKNGNGTQAGIGYPTPVREDGTVSLPLIDPVLVQGMSVLEAEDAIEKAYLDADILKGKNLVACCLLRKRTISLMVVHNKYPNSLHGQNSEAVTKVIVPAENATPLSALAEAGGYFDSHNVQVFRQSVANSDRLNEGDIVRAPLPEEGYFFAGGLLKSGRYLLPMDVPVNAIQAIAQAGGGGVGLSGFGPSEFTLTRGNQTFRYNTNWLMANPGALTIMPGDTISVRKTPADIVGETAIDLLRYSILRGGF